MVESFKTSIRRYKPSAPLIALLARGLVRGPVLDFGCGFGDDLLELHQRGIKADGYDPDPRHASTKLPRRKYRTVLCTYVLNVVSSREESEILCQIRDRLDRRYKLPPSQAFLAVRRDLPRNKGCQRIVRLPFPVEIRRAGSFEIYTITEGWT